MAKGDSSDVIMQFIDEDGNAVEAECQSIFDPSDLLIIPTPADPQCPPFKKGRFFEVDQFSFGMNLDDSQKTQDVAGQSGGAGGAPGGSSGGGSGGGATGSAGGSAGPKSGKFGAWKYASKLEQSSMPPYPVKMDEFTVTRGYDRASPILFEKCCNSDSFKSASLVKRKTIGASEIHGKGGLLHAFFRMDFTDVLLTHIQWKNDDPMTEDLRFVFRKLKVRYFVTGVDPLTKRVSLQPREPVEWSFEMQTVNSTGR
jgi:type VI protein secretion system component Hcp